MWKTIATGMLLFPVHSLYLWSNSELYWPQHTLDKEWQLTLGFFLYNSLPLMSRASPKSAILRTKPSAMRTFLAARSQWTICGRREGEESGLWWGQQYGCPRKEDVWQHLVASSSLDYTHSLTHIIAISLRAGAVSAVPACWQGAAVRRLSGGQSCVHPPCTLGPWC